MSLNRLVGFETGTLDELAATAGTPTLISTGQHTGNYGIETDSASDSFTFDARRTSISTATPSLQFWVKGAFDSGEITFASLDNFDDQSELLRIVVTGSKTLKLTVGGSGESTAVLSTSEWNNIHIRAERGTGSDGVVVVKINGVEETLTTTGTWAAGPVGDWTLSAPVASAHQWDDIGTGIQTSFFTDGAVIEAMRPNGFPSGGDDDFTLVTGGSETNKWEVVDDDPVSDSNYLEFTGSGVALQELDLSTFIVDTIVGIKQAARARRSGGGATVMFIQTQDSDENPQITFSRVFTTGFEYYEDDVVDIASTPANQTELDRWQVKLDKGSGGRDFDLSEYWLMLYLVESEAPSTVLLDIIQGPGVLVRSR